MGRLAWVTLATNDSYCLGALVLAHSLRKVGTQQEFAVLITPGVSDSMRDKLSQVFNVVQEVNILDSKDETNLLLLKRPELGVTFTKLHCWRLTQYEKCVFLDADTLVVKNCDELFEREELSAAPDVGWPDCFNSGVFVYRPSLETFESIVKFASEKGSFDGGDQGLLNLYFSGWAHQDISKHLPFIYNMCSTACYSYMPAFKQFGENVKIIHFIGTAKPWLQPFDTETCTVHPTPGYEHLRGLLQAWWDLFCACVHSALSSDMRISNWMLTQMKHNVHMNSKYALSYTDISKVYPREYHDCIENVYPKPNVNEIVYRYEYWDPWDEYNENKDDNLSKNNPSHTVHSNEYSELSDENYVRYINNDQTDLGKNSQTFTEKKCYVLPNYSHECEQNPNMQCSNYFENKATEIDNPPNQIETIEHFEPNLIIVENDSHVHNSFDNENICNFINSSQTNFKTHSFDTNNEMSKSHNVNIQTTTLRYVVHSTNCNEEESLLTNTYETTNILNENRHDTNVESHSFFNNVPNLDTNNSTAFTALQRSNCNIVADEVEENAGLAGAFAQMTLGAPRSGEQSALEDHFRRQSWEVGNIDYMGRDSFANIWQKICTTLSGPTPPSAPQPQQVIEEAPVQVQVETKQDAPKPPETQATGVCTPDASSGEEKQIPIPAQTEEIATAPTETPAQSHEPVPVSEQPESKSEVPQPESKSEIPQPESKTSEAAVQEPTQPETAKETSSEDTKKSESAKLIETEPVKTPVSDKPDISAVEPIQEQLITPVASSDSEKTTTVKQEVSVAELVIEPKAAKPSETEKVPESPVSQETKTLESSKAPESEKTPEPIKAPEPEKVLESVKASEPEKAPEPAKAPEPEKAPEPAKAPEPEKAPEPAKAVEPEKAPEQTKAPEPEKTSEAEKSPKPIKTEPVQATEAMKHSAPKEPEIKKELVQTPTPEVKDQSVALQKSEQTEEKSAVVKPVLAAKKVSDSTESEPKSKTKPTKSKSIETVEPEKPVEEKATESAAPKEQQKKKGGKKEQKQISKSEDSSTGPGLTVQPATPVEAPAQKPIEESGQLKEPAVEPLQTPPVSASKSKEDVSTKKQAPAKPETPTETGAECPLPPPRKEKKPTTGAAVKKTQQPKAKK